MNSIKQRIKDHIFKMENVSFMELSYLDGVKGDCEFFLEGFNLVLGAGLSSECLGAITELLDENQIHFVPTEEIIRFDGGPVPNYPVAKSIREYKKPRWLPIVFNPGSSPK